MNRLRLNGQGYNNTLPPLPAEYTNTSLMRIYKGIMLNNLNIKILYTVTLQFPTIPYPGLPVITHKSMMHKFVHHDQREVVETVALASIKYLIISLSLEQQTTSKPK